MEKPSEDLPKTKESPDEQLIQRALTQDIFQGAKMESCVY